MERGDSEEAWATMTSACRTRVQAALGPWRPRRRDLPSRSATAWQGALAFRKRVVAPGPLGVHEQRSLKGLKPMQWGSTRSPQELHHADGQPRKDLRTASAMAHQASPRNRFATRDLRHNGHGRLAHTWSDRWKGKVGVCGAPGRTWRALPKHKWNSRRVSGVSMTKPACAAVDNQAPHRRLRTCPVFEVDRQVNEVIGQIREGTGMGAAGQFVVPLAVEMPGWPVEVAIDVSSSPESWATSKRYGAANAKQSINLTRSEVAAGKLPEKILAAFDQTQINVCWALTCPAARDRLQRLRDAWPITHKAGGKSLSTVC